MTKVTGERIEGYLKRLFGYAVSLCNDRDQAEDLVHDCVVKALSAGKKPSDEQAYRAWLFRILKNTFVDGVRKSKVRSEYSDDELHQIGPEVWSLRETTINTLAVRQEMAKLPESYREIIGLIDIAGFSYSEAAILLGVPDGTVMSRISRARAHLLTAMQKGNVRSLPNRKLLK